VTVWGSGTPRREFIFADDVGDACVFVMKHYSGFGFLNIGTGEDITIREFAELVADVVKYEGKIIYDTSRPDGTPLKRLDVSKLKTLGWESKTPLRIGLEQAHADFLKTGGRGAA
jgi:GDP-L-fucose synthase